MNGKPQKNALAMAYNMKQKTQQKAQGGVCYACGGMVDGGRVSEQSTEHMGPESGGYMEDQEESRTPDFDYDDDEPEGFSEGGTVGDEPNDLEYSPEVPEGDMSNDEDEGENSKRSGFLRAYMIHRKMHG